MHGSGHHKQVFSRRLSWMPPPFKLHDHIWQVAFVAWSPDDQMLLTVSDEVVRLWQVHTGRLLHTFL